MVASGKNFQITIRPFVTHSLTALRKRLLERTKAMEEFYLKNRGIGYISVKQNSGDPEKEWEKIRNYISEKSGRREHTLAVPNYPLQRLLDYEELFDFLVSSVVVAERKKKIEFYHCFYAFDRSTYERVVEELGKRMNETIVFEEKEAEWKILRLEPYDAVFVGSVCLLENCEEIEEYHYPLKILLRRIK